MTTKQFDQICKTVMYKNEVYIRAIDLVDLFSSSGNPEDKVFLKSLIEVSKPENFK